MAAGSRARTSLCGQYVCHESNNAALFFVAPLERDIGKRLLQARPGKGLRCTPDAYGERSGRSYSTACLARIFKRSDQVLAQRQGHHSVLRTVRLHPARAVSQPFYAANFHSFSGTEALGCRTGNAVLEFEREFDRQDLRALC